ncbi:unnamed protein product [Peronospora farinosa]|uniref:Integrase catalytic domain-containing protein n=1 Tax=Peronospora farinosa TaxID=134698 RepID=A0ABN8BV60_9STRA|nr:unnamed protein product [Peronospora farinosa]
MDFIFGISPDEQKRVGVLVIVDRFSKMAHFAPVSAHITAETTAKIFIDLICRHHGCQNLLSRTVNHVSIQLSGSNYFSY